MKKEIRITSWDENGCGKGERGNGVTEKMGLELGK